MRALIIGFVIFLAACNGSGNSTPGITQADIQAAIAPLQSQVDGLQAENDKLKAGQAKLALIGKLHGVSTDAVGRTVDAVGNPVSFGPCTDMGLYQGQGGTDSANPLASQFEIYKQTADAQSGCPGATTSYNETTGLHDRLIYAVWDEPDCKGNMYVITDVPKDTMSVAALEEILVIMSPDITDNTVFASEKGSTPQPIQIQSSFNIAGGACSSPDIEIRMVIKMIVNDTHITGVPNSLVPGSWSRVAP